MSWRKGKRGREAARHREETIGQELGAFFHGWGGTEGELGRRTAKRKKRRFMMRAKGTVEKGLGGKGLKKTERGRGDANRNSKPRGRKSMKAGSFRNLDSNLDQPIS